MVLKRFCIYPCMFLLFICMIRVETIHAQDFSRLNGTSYLQPLSDDSLRYAWNLYELSLDFREKGCPSYFFELSAEAGRIFVREQNDDSLSWQELEMVLRNLEINFSRNRALIDKDEESSLNLATMYNILNVSLNLVRVKNILNHHVESQDNLFSFYSDWFQKCTLHYLVDYSLYQIKKGMLQEALAVCEKALALVQHQDTINWAVIVSQKEVIRYLMQPFPANAEDVLTGLKKLVSPAFTKEEIFRNGTMPLFYLYAMQVAHIYEKNGNLEQSIRAYRLLLGEIRKYLNPDFPYLLPEEREEIGFLLQYYLDTVQSFSLRHIRYKPVSELLFDHSLLKEELLAITPSPVSLTKKGLHPRVLTLQDSIDSLYCSPDYYLFPSSPRYFNKFQLLTDLMVLKRKQVSIVKKMGLDNSVLVQLEDWVSLRNRLKPHEAIIKIIDLPVDIIERQYVALVITSDSYSPKMASLPMKWDLLKIRVEKKETEKIWKPIRRLLDHQTELYFCLEGEFIDFGWNNILYEKKKLLESYDIHYLLNTKDFIRLKQDINIGKAAEYNLYGFGGAYFSQLPELKGVRGQGAQYLPGSREELLRIDSMLPEGWKSHLFLGSEATKFNFLRLSSRIALPSVIHVATHGFSLRYDKTVLDGRIVEFDKNSFFGSSAYQDPMMRNGFLLTGANRYWNKPVPYDAMDSGIVTAHDVSQMNLFGTDLVVLSACRSAAGETRAGEGLYGLVRAFKVAGVRAVLANFNNISDTKTVLFITTFYRHWIGGDSMFDAFCRTQRELMESNPEDEFLWSGFVLFE
mgnify:FL=1